MARLATPRTLPSVLRRRPRSGSKVVMELRVLIAIFLSFIVLYLYHVFLVNPAPKSAAKPTAQSEPSATGSTSATTNATALVPPRGPGPAQPSAATLVGDTMEREVRVDTRDVIAVF